MLPFDSWRVVTLLLLLLLVLLPDGDAAAGQSRFPFSVYRTRLALTPPARCIASEAVEVELSQQQLPS
jgi:hypothetical protein